MIPCFYHVTIMSYETSSKIVIIITNCTNIKKKNLMELVQLLTNTYIIIIKREYNELTHNLFNKHLLFAMLFPVVK